MVLRLESLGYVARGLVAEQRVGLSVNGHRLQQWNVKDAGDVPPDVEIGWSALPALSR